MTDDKRFIESDMQGSLERSCRECGVTRSSNHSFRFPGDKPCRQINNYVVGNALFHVDLLMRSGRYAAGETWHPLSLNYCWILGIWTPESGGEADDQ